RLACVGREGKKMKERVARRVESPEISRRGAIRSARLEDQSGASHRGQGVAHGAARALESRSKAVLDGLDLGEVVEAETKLRELDGRDSRQRIAGFDRRRLRNGKPHAGGERDEPDRDGDSDACAARHRRLDRSPGSRTTST